MKGLMPFAACVSFSLLVACTSGTERQTVNVAGETIGGLFNREEPSQVTFTRAQLDAANIDQPLLVGRLSAPVALSAGFAVAATTNDLQFWRSGDGSTIKTDEGVLRGTVGISYDLYSAETRDTVKALRDQQGQGYFRVYRHLNALNQLDVMRFECEMSAPSAETVVVFEISYAVNRLVETCVAERPDPSGDTIEMSNTFWRERNRMFLWKSEQWISKEAGHVVLERVIE